MGIETAVEDEDPNREEMDSDEAEQLVELILNGEKELERTEHFWTDPKHRNFDITDAFRVLRKHTMVGKPMWDEDLGNHKVELDGRLRGGPVKVFVGLRRVGPCSLITMYRPRGHRRNE